MRILVMGYFGSANSGDDAVLSGVVNLIDKCTGAQNTYCVMSSHKGEPNNVGEYIKNPWEFVWYDSLPGKIDLVIVATTQIMGGFFINPVLMAMHKGIPVIMTCIKTAMTDSPIFKEVYAPILKRVKYACTRLKKNHDSWQEQGFSNVEYGVDFAVYNEPEKCTDDTYDNSVIICPRLSDNDNNEVSNDFQVWWITNYIRSNNSDKFFVIPFSNGDSEMCALLRMYKALTVVDIKHYEFKKVMGIFQRAKMIISTGRLHAMIYAVMAGRPVVYATNIKTTQVRIPEKGSDPDRFNAFANDFSIPMYDNIIKCDAMLQAASKINYPLMRQLTTYTEIRMKETLDKIFNKGA